MADTCRSCKATIRWVVMPSGRMMPLDAQPSGKYIVVEDDKGRMVDVYVSHFATCPAAAKHRKQADG